MQGTWCHPTPDGCRGPGDGADPQPWVPVARGEHQALPAHCPASARSHKAILKVPNELFYDSELKAYEGSEPDVRNFYCTWEELPNRVGGAAGRGVGGAPALQLS